MNKFIIPVLLAMMICMGCGRRVDFASHESAQIKVKFTPPVENVLIKNIETLQPQLQKDDVVQALMKANQQRAVLSLKEIMKKDQEWVESPDDSPLIREALDRPCSVLLKQFQQGHAGYDEIFITDRYGMNVCQTNRTSDWYQADEAWWTESYAKGTGKPAYGRIEFDESALSESIPLYIPVHQPSTGEIIGVAKAVVSLEKIRQEL